MSVFRIPSLPADLVTKSDESALTVVQDIAIAGLKAEEVQEFAEGLVYDLVNDNALCITKQKAFDGVYCLIRDFAAVPALAKTHLVDSLCSGLSLLNASASALIEAPDDSDTRKDALSEQHHSALKAYVFFLHWIASQAEQEQKAAASKTAPAAAAANGRTKGKKAAQISSSWDWDADREKLAKAFAGISQIDLWRLCSPNNPEEAFLLLWSQTALLLISTAAAAKDKAAKEAAFKVLACCALRYKQLEHLVAALSDMLNKDEHMSGICAELAEYAAKQLGNNQLAVELLREVASVDPLVYEQQQQADAAGVRSVAGFIAELSDRLPHVVASNISLLAPHLGGKAYPIRSAIVTAIGHLIQRAFGPTAEGADAQGTSARLRSKQQLLHTLVERIRDQNAYTRARVLQTWMHLAEKTAVPLGRLEDKAAIVRKCALQLLSKLLCFNPFGRFLPLDQLAASLNDYKTKLQVMQPAHAEADPAQWAGGELQPSSQPAESHGSAVSPNRNTADADTADSNASGSVSVSKSAAAAAADGLDGNPASTGTAAGGQQGVGGGDPQMQLETETQLEGSVLGTEGQAASGGIDSNLEQTRTIVASLQTAVDFVKVLSESLAVVTQLLASSTMTDVQESITLLIYCHKFQIQGAQAALRKMLPLMFSREQGVKDAVVDAVEELYLKAAADGFADPRQAAQNLVALAQGSSLGELGALEEVVGQLVSRGLVKPLTLKTLWFICSSAYDQLAASGGQGAEALQALRSSLTVISMAAMKQPQFVAEHQPLLLKVGFRGQHQDALITRQACIALTQLRLLPSPPPHHSMQQVYQSLTWVLLSDSLQDSTWYTAAEAAVTAMYALHPAPQQLAQVAVQTLGKAALGSQSSSSSRQSDSGEAMETDDMPQASAAAPGGSAVSASRLSRLFFVLGQVAIQHLLYVERVTKSVRRRRADAEKAAAEAQHAAGPSNLATAGNKKDDEDEDIAAQLGVGSLAADVQLDALKDAAESEIVGMHNLLGRYAPLLAALCHNRALLGSHAHLRSSALLALTKLMAVDPTFCDANLALVFTLLEKRSVEPSVRSNLVIALGDLAFRFPNLLEPWTERIYGPLSDPDTGVRKNSLMVLTHLIMNDMMKVKGHIARMALCLQDPHPRIKDLAHLFFHELAQKNYKGTSPIYNLLPDMLSSLSKEASLPPEQFQSIMRHLLSFIAKEKQVDSLVEKLCLRFAATQDHKQWKNIAFCLGQLSIGEKGFRKMANHFRCYKDSLADPDILTFFQGCIAKAKKMPKLGSETKADIEAFEAKLEAAAAEKQAEQALAAAALQHAAVPQDDEEQHGQLDAEDDQAAPIEAGEQMVESNSAAASMALEPEAAGSEQTEAMQGTTEETTHALDQQAQASDDTSTLAEEEGSEVGRDESSTGGVEQQLQQMALQSSGHASDDANFADEEEQESDSGASSKENRQQAGNTQSSQPQPTAHARLSAGAAQSKRLSSKASSAKTHRSNRLSGTSGISQVQDAEHGSSALESTHSAGQESVLGPASPQARLTPDSPAAASATRDSDAHSVGCESTGLQPSVLAEPASQEVPAPGPLPAAVTPLKASHAKAAGDLDKLLGSRLKPVRPAAEARQSEEATASPMAALRGQLRKVKLEEGREAASPVSRASKDVLGTSAGLSPSQAVPSVQLRQVKQEPEVETQPSQQQAMGQGKKGVSALKGFWETQKAAKPGTP